MTDHTQGTDDDGAADDDGSPPPDNRTVPVVAVLAAAHDPDSLRDFLKQLQPGGGIAYVLLIERPAGIAGPEPAMLARLTSLPLKEVAAPAAVEPDRVYLARPGTALRLEDGILLPRPAQREAGPGLAPTDGFLLSLAEETGVLGVCAVLSVAGGDGLFGLHAIRSHGGLCLVRTPDSDHAPAIRRAVAGGFVDRVLDTAAMPAEILAHFGIGGPGGERPVSDGTRADVLERLPRITALLRERTRQDFADYKPATVARRVQRRMHATGLHEAEAYVARLADDPDEVQFLLQDLLIGVTQFFRDRGAFDALDDKVVARLFDGRTGESPVRVWVAGCATGEEAYSIAILLMEQARRRKVSPPVTVFATDIDRDALDHARRGAYPQSALASLPAPLVDRYFTIEDGVCRARHALRERILFARHNLLSDPPFSRLDLVSCRNVLIYLNAGIQGRVLQLFHYALKEGGYLFLGASESPGRETGRFAVVDRVNRVYRRDGGTTRVVPEFPLISAGHAATRPAGPQTDAMVTRRTEQVIAERFSPAWILVDEDLAVRDSARAEGRWLDAVAAGPAGAGVLERARPAIRDTLAATLEQARRSGTRSRGDGPVVEVDGQQRRLSLVVEPLDGDQPSDPPLYLVVFETVAAASGTGRGEGGPAAPSPGAVVPAEHDRLGTELQETRQRLQAAIEELEATNEELKASNEELASMNEELHATNEQLETSKEELQSSNEELQTVNTELNQRVDELAQANADQMNLFDNTNVAMLFIDRNMRIRNFTPPLAEIFYVVDADKGRPVQHIAHRLQDQDVLARARQVLEGAGSDEREVALRDGDEVFLLLIQPYRMLDGRIDGVVLSFTDVTRLKESERRLQESERRQRLLLRELQHRVKNMLASMRALVNRTYSDSATLESFHEALQGRLEAMSRAQLLVGAAGGRSVDLKELFLEEFLALAVEVGRDAEVEGPDLLLAARAAETFALAIHELATNAVKFGALSVENGRVDVGWRVEQSDDVPILLLEWRERGVQLAGQPERRGFGHMMIERGLPYEMGGTSRLEFLDDGCRCVMEIPLADNFETGAAGNGVGAGA